MFITRFGAFSLGLRRRSHEFDHFLHELAAFSLELATLSLEFDPFPHELATLSLEFKPFPHELATLSHELTTLPHEYQPHPTTEDFWQTPKINPLNIEVFGVRRKPPSN
ncbi:hypothetical protein [Lentibacillus salicampi]|uniref:Uncharacterized protein n=1 Tax=Lentibacillus salicampi TaxID=175306 RepID=A0A4Y9AAY6_9BACI|nr:hypothetical protein [Lentibacillus salicampi]TFJ93079.1 hypothetical protein E4U82_09020 [Lentibacillus salicampi]